MKTTLPLLASLCLTCSILKSQTWTPQGAGMLPTGYAIFSLSVVNDSVVWLAASKLSAVSGNVPVPADHLIKILRTADGGETWQSHDVEESIGRICFDLVGVDANTAWITTQDYGSGLGRALYKTVDGGENWMQKLKHPAAGVFLRRFDEQHFFCQNNWVKAWSSDGGETWSLDTLTQYGTTDYNILISGNNMAAVVGDTVWVGTANGRMERSTNYGEVTEFFNTGFLNIQCVTFKDHLNGMLFYFGNGSNFGLARSADGGKTWQATPTKPLTTNEYNVTYVPGTSGTYITTTNMYGFGAQNYLTTDFGATWIQTSSIGTSGRSNGIDFHSPTTGWVARGGNLTTPNLPIAYKYSGDALSGLKDHFLPLTGFHVSPNPASGFIGFDFDGFTGAPFQLTLTDATGRVVVFEKTTIKILNVSGLTPGLYFLKIQTGGRVGVEKILKQ